MDITKVVTKTGLVLKQYSPEIFLGLSLVAGGVALYQGIKYGQRIERAGTIRKAREALLELRENPDENSNQLRQDIIMNTIKELVGPAIPMVGAALVSAACAAASYKILNGRYVATAASLTSVIQAFNEYRERSGGMLATYPNALPDPDTNGSKLPDDQTFTDGVNAKLEKELTEMGVEPQKLNVNGTGFGFNWDKFSCFYRPSDNASNAHHIQAVEHHLNQLLIARGHVFLNDLHDQFDVRRTDVGQLVGWVRDANHPDAHIVLFPVTAVSPLLGASEIKIESNVMGVVFNLI